MIPFPTMTAVRLWWEHNAMFRACSVLIDYTDIGQGLQRREVRRPAAFSNNWYIGFPDSPSAENYRRLAQ